MYCYKLLLAYDGTSYSGWQIQPNAPSIQQKIQDSLEIFLGGEKVSVIGSGRTDAGVHALGQVAHFKTGKNIDPNRLLFSLNGLLPQTIRIKQIDVAPPDFHAQYDAKSKEYHYHLYLERVMNPCQRLYAWHVLRKLDLALLKEGASLFLGVHDFTSFANERGEKSVSDDAVRTLYRLDVCVVEGGVRLEFEGNGFLYKMVRNIVGTLVDLAAYRCTIPEILSIFDACDRRRAPQAAPAHGLFLVKVNYEMDFIYQKEVS